MDGIEFLKIWVEVVLPSCIWEILIDSYPDGHMNYYTKKNLEASLYYTFISCDNLKFTAAYNCSLLCIVEHKVIIVGLDNAGKTTILYQL